MGKLKGCTKGYASLDYEEAGYRKSDIVKMQLCVNGEPQDALTTVIHRSQAQARVRSTLRGLRNFELPAI